MPSPRKGARLWLRPARPARPGHKGERAQWIIRDGPRQRATGCGAGEREQAETALADYIIARHAAAPASPRGAGQILIADVLNCYLTEIAPQHARPAETAGRVLRLLDHFGTLRLDHITGARCRAYVMARGAPAAARRELEDLRAASNHYAAEGYLTERVRVWLPPRARPRERWLTRAEAARLLWAAWRYREVQRGKGTARASRRHVARFALVALYTGSRAGVIMRASLTGPEPGRGWIDLATGMFYRRAQGERESNKRAPPVLLPRRLLAHLRRWRAKGQRYVVEWNGRPVGSVKKAFAHAAREAGLAGVSPHVLRHTAATWLMQAGVGLWDAAGYLGMSVETLSRVYGHHHPAHGAGSRAAFDGGALRPAHRVAHSLAGAPSAHRGETRAKNAETSAKSRAGR